MVIKPYLYVFSTIIVNHGYQPLSTMVIKPYLDLFTIINSHPWSITVLFTIADSAHGSGSGLTLRRAAQFQPTEPGGAWTSATSGRCSMGILWGSPAGDPWLMDPRGSWLLLVNAWSIHVSSCFIAEHLWSMDDDGLLVVDWDGLWWSMMDD